MTVGAASARGGWTLAPGRGRVNSRGERCTRPRNSRTVTNALAHRHKNPIKSRWWKACVESRAIVGRRTGPGPRDAVLRYLGNTLNDMSTSSLHQLITCQHLQRLATGNGKKQKPNVLGKGCNLVFTNIV